MLKYADIVLRDFALKVTKSELQFDSRVHYEINFIKITFKVAM